MKIQVALISKICCLLRMVGIYDDLNILERILEGSHEPNNLSYQLFQFVTENFSVKRMMGHNEFGEFFKVKINFHSFLLHISSQKS